MRILHVITSLYTGGAEKLMVDLLPLIRKDGNLIELCIFCGDRTPFYEELEKQGIKIHTFHRGMKLLYHPINIYRLYKLIKGHRYDVVHTHNTAPQLFAAICHLFLSVTLVTTEHSSSNRRRNWKGCALFDRWMYRQYKKVICISDQAEINHRQYLGKKYSQNVCTIYNGIDYQKYSHALPAKDVQLLSTKIVTNVAGFRLEKDQPTLIKSLLFLPQNFHLCLVGDGERRAEYESLINELNLGGRVHLLGVRTDVPEVLAASDYIVMCSHFEGLSLSSLEGMGSGKPFLASNVDGLREIVEGNGVLFEHEDAQGFANAVMQLDRDKNYRERIVTQCQSKAANYDIGIMVKKYLAVYKQLLEIRM